VSEQWFHADTNSLITMTPDSGSDLGHGYHVRLNTRQPVGSDFLREIFTTGILPAAERVAYLMTLIPGDWWRITGDPGALALITPEQRAAWQEYQRGESAPVRLLPTLGRDCDKRTKSGAACGWDLLIDGSCLNHAEHSEAETLDQR
jgi:hypothetical protein